jgi:hypothetical protein
VDLWAALAHGFAGHDPLASCEFGERAERASALLRDGYAQADLNVLAGEFPVAEPEGGRLQRAAAALAGSRA